MKALHGNYIYLRALEPEDLDTLHRIENDEELWNIGETMVPYSKYVLKEYIANSHRDLFEAQQLRLVICRTNTNEVVGLIDLFDFDPHNLRAGIGIMISGGENKRKGFASEALALIKNYSAVHLKIHQLYANIQEDNKNSVSLFVKAGFQLIGIKKDWRRKRSLPSGQEIYTNELLYQHIL